MMSLGQRGCQELYSPIVKEEGWRVIAPCRPFLTGCKPVFFLGGIGREEVGNHGTSQAAPKRKKEEERGYIATDRHLSTGRTNEISHDSGGSPDLLVVPGVQTGLWEVPLFG